MKIISDKTYKKTRRIVGLVGPRGLSRKWLDALAYKEAKVTLSPGRMHPERLYVRVVLPV